MEEQSPNQKKRLQGRFETLAVHLLAAAGFFVVLAAGGAELLGWSQPGVGQSQLALALSGYGLLVAHRWWGSVSETRTREAFERLTVGLLLGLLVIVFQTWRIEGVAFYERLLPVVFFGFLVHQALPRSWRPTAFLVASLGGLLAVFGLGNGGWMILLGLGLVGLCHLPLRFGVRVGLLSAAGASLLLMRADVWPSSWPSLIWPILASMFMFRLIVYMYDLRHGNIPPSWSQRLSYFFLLPNPLFPLFPVVDAQTYHRRYYDGKTEAIYLRGVEWMTRGVVHLLLYRFVYQVLSISAVDVATPADLGRYLLTNFGLYLRVSGQFHLIVGMLHLFGYRLPETHKLYWLSSSFADFWRRINIYWKDFVQKVVFFPVFMRIRKWRFGEGAALVVATLSVFAATWLLHSYQWYWILGEWLITGPDLLFWAILAVLLIGNTLRERKRGRMRRLSRTLSFKESAGLALRTAGVFTVICLLWALWNSPTVGDFTALFTVVDWGEMDWLLWTAGFLGVTVLLAAGARALASTPWRFEGTAAGFGRQAVLVTVTLVALLSVVQPAVTGRLSVDAQVAFRSIIRGELSARDVELLRRGYYENLVGVGRLSSQIWEVRSEQPDDWIPFFETPAARRTQDYLWVHLVPNSEIIYKGAAFRTNRWGLRDRDYEKVPPPGTYRIALLGASYVMGVGVKDGENFESLVEERLNEEHPTGHERYELLNFSVPGYAAPRQALLLDRIAEFQPDAVWIFSYTGEEQRAAEHLALMASRGIEPPDSVLRELAGNAGWTPEMSFPERERRLRPMAREILRRAYQQIAEGWRARGIRPVWFYLPPTDTPDPRAAFTELRPLVEETGFELIDLSDVYAGYDPTAIRLASYDTHPNVLGHRIIADYLLDVLRSRPEIVLGERDPFEMSATTGLTADLP